MIIFNRSAYYVMMKSRVCSVKALGINSGSLSCFLKKRSAEEARIFFQLKNSVHRASSLPKSLARPLLLLRRKRTVYYFFSCTLCFLFSITFVYFFKSIPLLKAMQGWPFWGPQFREIYEIIGRPFDAVTVVFFTYFLSHIP